MFTDVGVNCPPDIADGPSTHDSAPVLPEWLKTRGEHNL